MPKKDLHLYFHDLRAPVVGIRGYLKMLLDGSFGELPGEASEKLQLVYQETERLHDIIEEMVLTLGDEE
jgi:two-component system, OmpR family, phosphate regulon sensor histidine kinase PhoR